MKNKVIIAMGVAIGVLLFLYLSRPKIIETVTETKIEWKTKTVTIDNTKPTEIKEVVIKVPVIVYDTINNTVVETDTIYKDKEVKKYVYKDSLENGLLKSTILADMIYKRSIQLDTYNSTETTTTTNTIVKSQLFIGASATFTLDKEFNNASVNAYYVHKDKWLLNGGGGILFETKEPVVNLGVGFKF